MPQYQTNYESSLGTLILTSDGNALTGVYFGQKELGVSQQEKTIEREDLPIFQVVRQWLDGYFKGEQPEISFELAPKGTPFQQKVWQQLKEIPYGQTITYGEIARKIAQEMGKEKMSSQAVGGAVGSNPISIIIPCHRVIGKNGSVTGYGGGVERKLALFVLEKVAQETYFVPKNFKEAKKFVI